MDENYFIYLLDRKKDTIIVSRFNVYPNEIEEVLSSSPIIREVAVISVPSKKSAKIKTFIVKKDESLMEEDVLKFFRNQLTIYKVPKVIEF
ncbi:AMP-binding enzyme [Coxiella-like endosymbiont]|uniref:AMP-binding enzyme n=1 Tax=Coxiella-like endosymbiont TaxID=1592897 RepID=UPI00272B1898|nr:hypothetical protein [Coxiella-like endosymbiont]